MLALQPISLKKANQFVSQRHRHHGPVSGHKFSIACVKDGELAGVVIAGRPVARMLDDGYTLEVTRLCTDGAENACAFLYGAAVRAARAMGYRRAVTYTLESESGASLKAAGFTLDGVTDGGSWDRPSRRRTDKAPTTPKKRWIKTFP
jgi:hypothetical protein